MFERAHHNRIQALLSALDAEFLTRNKCFFGGGTAIVLALNEYRESVDIDLLCADQEGYRELRNTINDHSLGAIFSQPVELVREVRAAQCLAKMHMAPDLVEQIPAVLRGDASFASAPPGIRKAGFSQS